MTCHKCGGDYAPFCHGDPPACIIDGCSRKVHARDLCLFHYCRFRKDGTIHLYPTATRTMRHGTDVVEDIEYILSTEQTTLSTAAERLGMNPHALERALYRHNRPDLVKRLRPRAQGR